MPRVWRFRRTLCRHSGGCARARGCTCPPCSRSPEWAHEAHLWIAPRAAPIGRRITPAIRARVAVPNMKGSITRKLYFAIHRVVSDRTVDSHVKNLRRKLQEANPDLEVIRAIYGIGYKLEL